MKDKKPDEPVTDRCPACSRRGLVVRGSRREGTVHEHTQRGNVALGVPGGCGYVAAWLPQPPFVRQPVNLPRPLGWQEGDDE